MLIKQILPKYPSPPPPPLYPHVFFLQLSNPHQYRWCVGVCMCVCGGGGWCVCGGGGGVGMCVCVGGGGGVLEFDLYNVSDDIKKINIKTLPKNNVEGRWII